MVNGVSVLWEIPHCGGTRAPRDLFPQGTAELLKGNQQLMWLSPNYNWSPTTKKRLSQNILYPNWKVASLNTNRWASSGVGRMLLDAFLRLLLPFFLAFSISIFLSCCCIFAILVPFTCAFFCSRDGVTLYLGTGASAGTTVHPPVNTEHLTE